MRATTPKPRARETQVPPAPAGPDLAAELAREQKRRERLEQLIGSLALIVRTAAAGDLTQQVPDTDEPALVPLADAVNTLLANVRQAVAAVAAAPQALARASAELAQVVEAAKAATTEDSGRARSAAAAAAEVGANVETVSASMAQMGASIREISKNTYEAAVVATGAMKAAESTQSTVAKLSESSAQIGNVIKVITSIAQQTNLLALNATIEAARAGEAGKGFAVVANEVKELAKQTAKATDDIGRKIEATQADAASVVGAIEQIVKVIGDINSAQSTIAATVEEQSATAASVVRNASDAAGGATRIARMLSAANDGRAGRVSALHDSGQRIAETTAALEKSIARFLY